LPIRYDREGMTKKARTILFLIFAALFLLISPLVVLYSQGYRIDFDNKKIVQTGGIYLKVIPKQTDVFLDGKLVKKTDFFFGSVLIDGLLPKNYKIEVKKENYQGWEKNLNIKEKMVTEAKNIILFPENISFGTLASKVKKIWLAPDQQKIVLKEETEQGWALKLYDLDKRVKSHLIYEANISKQEADLFDLSFSENSEEIFLGSGVGEEEKYFKLEINKTSPILEEVSPPSTPEILERAVAYYEIDDDIYFLDNLGYLFKVSSSLENKIKLNENPFPLKQETDYELAVFGDYIFLRENKLLYKFNYQLNYFEEFFENTNKWRASPDSKKLAYSSDNELWVFYLKDGVLGKKAGDNFFLFRLSNKIGDFYWLNSDYLVFSAGDSVKICEIDNRDKINFAKVGEFKNPDFFWNSSDRNLYILSEEKLYKSTAELIE